MASVALAATSSSTSTFLACPTLFPLTKSTPFSLFFTSAQTHVCHLKAKQRVSTQTPLILTRLHATAVAEQPAAISAEEASRRLYIGNLPRTVTTEEITKMLEEHGAVDKAEVMYDKLSGRSRRFGFATMKTVEDANAVVEKLNGTKIGDREIKVNITEKPYEPMGVSLLQKEESEFVDSGYKVYVGNLAKTVTADKLKELFSEKGKVVSAKVQRDPGSVKSKIYGFVSLSSEEEVDAVIEAFNNTELEGQKIRVNGA